MIRGHFVRILLLLFLFPSLTLPFASAASDYYPHPWGIYLEPFVLYADSKGALVGVQYNYYEEAGHFSNGVLKPVEPWAYFIFYVNQTGVYYVDFMAFSGCEFPPFTFYHGWLYLFLLTSTNTSFPMREPIVSNTVTVIRYREGIIQKLGEVPWWIGSLNVSMPYFLITKPGPNGEERFLYKIDGSVKLVATGENLTLKGNYNATYYLTLFWKYTFINKECLVPTIVGDYVWLWPSHYGLPQREVNDTLRPMNLSCALFFNDGLLIVPSGVSLGFANGSMWVGNNYWNIVLRPGEDLLPRPLNVSLYFYKNGVWKELALLQASEKGVIVLAPPLKYVETIPEEWYRTPEGKFVLLLMAIWALMLLGWDLGR